MNREEAFKIYIDGIKTSNKETAKFKLAEEFLKELGLFGKENISEKAEVEDRSFQRVCEACYRLFEILKDFTILRTGRFDEELEEIKEVLKKDDSYVGRTFLYEKLVELPKYARLEKEEKIVLAMKLGALDSRDLSYTKKLEEE